MVDSRSVSRRSTIVPLALLLIPGCQSLPNSESESIESSTTSIRRGGQIEITYLQKQPVEYECINNDEVIESIGAGVEFPAARKGESKFWELNATQFKSIQERIREEHGITSDRFCIVRNGNYFRVLLIHND